MSNLFGGFGSDSTGTGLSPFDLQAISNVMGLNSEAMHNRYEAQLGLGTTSGDPAAAAKAGTSLQVTGPGTAESADLSWINNLQGPAALGQLQNQGLQQQASSGGGSTAGSSLGTLAGLAGAAGNIGALLV